MQATSSAVSLEPLVCYLQTPGSAFWRAKLTGYQFGRPWRLRSSFSRFWFQSLSQYWLLCL